MGKLVAYRQLQGAAGELSDAALVAACATGDPAALAALFRRHSPALVRFLSRLVGVDSRDVDDLVQATFLAVSHASASFAGASSVKTWLFGIASNIAGKHVRSEVRRRSMRDNVAKLAVVEPIGPDSLAEHRQLLRRLETALANLPHELRVVFVLCVVEGVPGKEAAHVLGLREGTLWRRLHEARTELRQAVEGT